MKDKILKIINTPWFPGILIILALVIFIMLTFFRQSTPETKVNTDTGTLIININGLRNNKGNIIVLLFTAAPLSRENVSDVRILKVANDKLTAVFSNKSFSDYAILVFHDENSNNNPDFSTDGVCLEGFGLSNIKEPHQTIGEFDEAKFHFDQGTSEIQVTVFYN